MDRISRVLFGTRRHPACRGAHLRFNRADAHDGIFDEPFHHVGQAGVAINPNRLDPHVLTTRPRQHRIHPPPDQAVAPQHGLEFRQTCPRRKRLGRLGVEETRAVIAFDRRQRSSRFQHARKVFQCLSGTVQMLEHEAGEGVIKCRAWERQRVEVPRQKRQTRIPVRSHPHRYRRDVHAHKPRPRTVRAKSSVGAQRRTALQYQCARRIPHISRYQSLSAGRVPAAGPLRIPIPVHVSHHCLENSKNRDSRSVVGRALTGHLLSSFMGESPAHVRCPRVLICLKAQLRHTRSRAADGALDMSPFGTLFFTFSTCPEFLRPRERIEHTEPAENQVVRIGSTRVLNIPVNVLTPLR